MLCRPSGLPPEVFESYRSLVNLPVGKIKFI